MTKYYVFYLLVMTSNVSSGHGYGTFLCPRVSLVGICSVACVVLQRVLHHRHYGSLPCVSLRSTSFQFHTFPVWHDFDGERALVFATIAPLGSFQILQCVKHIPSGEEWSMFSNPGVINLTKNIHAMIHWPPTIVPLESYMICQAGFPSLFNNS